MVRFLTFCVAAWLPLSGAVSPASNLWDELAARRNKLSSAHQEFQLSQTSRTAHGEHAVERRIVIDMAPGVWREAYLSGSGNQVTIFDGRDLLTFDDGGDEFMRVKPSPKEEPPAPGPYGARNPDWQKAKELERRSCGIPGRNDQCVILEALIRASVRQVPSGLMRVTQGSVRLMVDLENGLILSARKVEFIEHPRGNYQTDMIYTATSLAYGAPADANLFKLPSADLREVRELSRWNASKIKKVLAGNPAPELTVTDIQGKPAALSSFKGKIVLLDFWTTWCPPCRADAPVLDKLYRKYNERDLMIFGISVSEDRPIVEKFLKEHPHDFPVVLTTENEMPRPYQIGVFPTYIVIGRDGTVASAVEGDQGFSDLRKLLKKAGLEVD